MSKNSLMACVSLCLFASAALAADGTGWKPIFNGKNLSGWSVHYASKTPADAPAGRRAFSRGERRNPRLSDAGRGQ